ncbi:MAG: hypothetical protein F6K31_07560 [Symploca sp. SIO2G7]|nr:hypothetical protein [Symploca sp. SIO2G7]
MSSFLISLIAHNGKYVCAEGGGGGSLIANRDEIGPWETFRLIHLSNKLDRTDAALVALQTHNGHYVRAEDGGGGLVVANGNAIGSWETFELIDVGYNDGVSRFELALRTHKGYYTCVEDGDEGLLVASQATGYSSRDVFTGIIKDSLPGLNFLDSLFLKRIQDKHKQAKRVGSLGSKLDELLAFKAEMVEKIEDTVTFIEQNCFDRRLENSILFLAGYGDDENSREDIGFNGSDSRFGHYLAQRLQSDENLTLKQAEAALQMMQKYSFSQLEPNGYSLPTAWEEISHQYHERTIESELPALSVVLKTGDRIVLSTGEYCDTYIAAYYPDETVYEHFVEYVEDIWDYGRERGSVNVLLDSAPRLVDAVVGYIENGYRCYVDPNIEAAIYLWEQERQRIASQREPVLPLSAVPSDALLLDAVPLESERGVDYQGLRELLQQQEWYKADKRTAELVNDMCDNLKEFPCEDLRTLDRLWVAASGGKFGFSVQKKIWLELGLTNQDIKEEDVEEFADAVGWRFRERQIFYRKIPFNLSTAPNGYFPQWSPSIVCSGYYDWYWAPRMLPTIAFHKESIFDTP